MRKDIQININTGDIVIEPQNSITTRLFKWVDNPLGLSRYIYGEITVPWYLPESQIKSNGLCIVIPYTPMYKEFYIRVKRLYADQSYSFIVNPVDGTEWFLARTGLYGKEKKNVYASQLITISENNFFISFNGKYVDIYSGNETDVNIIKANQQNSNLLLKCIPTNNYRYPLSGVGLIQWLHSNINYTDLSYVIKKEFEADRVNVKGAEFDTETKQLYLDLDYSKVDEDGEI
nr:MAG TPA: hypothetical protein [Caudoviricetes sp.]